MRKICLALLGCFALATPANSAIIVTLQSITFNVGTNDYSWTYLASLQPDANMRVSASPPPSSTLPNDFVTLYDFAGYVSGSLSWTSLVGGRTFTSAVQNVGDVAPGIVPVDSALVPNLNLYLTGGGNIVPSPFGTAVDILSFSARSAYGNEGGLSNYGAQSQKKQNLLTASNVGLVEAPVAPAVPEPSTWGMMLLGFGVLGSAMRIRRRRLIAST